MTQPRGLTAEAILLLPLALALGPAARGEEVPPSVREAAAAPISNLQVLPDTSEISTLRWATWMSGQKADTNAVWIALLRRGRTGAVSLFSAHHKHGYEPKIEILYNWHYAGRPTVAFTWKMGAGATELELYGLDHADKPVLLGEADAVRFLPRYHQDFYLEAYQGPNDPKTCLFFDREKPELVSRDCPE